MARSILLLPIFLFCYAQTCFAQFTLPKILKHPANQIKVEIINILNSPYRETNLNISPDGKYLFFMSGRGQMPWSVSGYTNYKGKPEHDGDIWYSKKTNGQWTYPQCLGSNINTNTGEDEPNISPDGQRVVFQSWKTNRLQEDVWAVTGGPYYQSSLNGNVWGFPVGLGGGINAFFVDKRKNSIVNDYATDGATMSADGKTFIVAVGEYSGNMDLYISHKNEYGQWSYLKKLNISTLGDERSPFLASDGKTLYFASDGYGGWGGLEILKTTLNADDTHGEVINLGAPFNTWLDDYGFVLTASGNDAYFVREGDIYYANTQNANPELKPSTSTLLISGTITSSKTQKGIGATVKIVDAKTKALIAQGQSNVLTGEYAIVLPTTATHVIQEVSKTGFTAQSKEHKTVIQPGLNQIDSDMALAPIETAAVSTLSIAGNISDSKTQKGLPALIKIMDRKTKKVIVQANSEPNGNYAISLPLTATDIIQEVTKIGFEKAEKMIQVQIKAGANKIDSDIALNPITPPDKEAAADMGKEVNVLRTNR